MAEKFTASNGVTVNGYTSFDQDYLYCVDAKGVTCATAAVDGAQALREFFGHEKDELYGRWRWPEHPEYVVYPIPGDRHRVRVVYEPHGIAHALSPDSATSDTQGSHRAARAYWEAHRDQPWYHARPGEIWVLSVDGRDIPCRVTPTGPDFEPLEDPDWATIARGSDRITSARRIWPEGGES